MLVGTCNASKKQWRMHFTFQLNNSHFLCTNKYLKSINRIPLHNHLNEQWIYIPLTICTHKQQLEENEWKGKKENRMNIFNGTRRIGEESNQYTSQKLVCHKLYVVPITIFTYCMTLHNIFDWQISDSLLFLLSLQEKWCRVDRPQDCKFLFRN